MCLILDTDNYGLFLAPDNEDMKPVRDWIDNKNGRIAYSPVGKMKNELERYPKMRNRFTQYRRAGKLKDFSREAVEREKKRLPKLRSNDPDIIALAQVSGVGVLISSDTNLHADFKAIIGGSIYQTQQHTHLLKKDICP
jgi:hypothetical protein